MGKRMAHPGESESSADARGGESESVMLKEVALSFLRLGTTAFGGPAAHIAMMEDEFVRRRRWLSHQQFLDLLGATNLIPGPTPPRWRYTSGIRKRGGRVWSWAVPASSRPRCDRAGGGIGLCPFG